MKQIAEKKDIVIILIALLALTITILICNIVINSTITDISKRDKICVSLINESYQGDKYYVYCMDREEYELEMEALQYEKMV